MDDRRRLPCLFSLPLMVAGSFAAHWLGSLWFGPHARVLDPDGGLEGANRVDHGWITLLPLVAGVGIAVTLLYLAVRVCRAIWDRAHVGVSPLWFLALPPLGFALQEVAERLLRAEVIPFHPAHEPTFLAGLALQLPFGLLAYFVGVALLGLGTKLTRIVSGSGLLRLAPAPASELRPAETVRPRTRVPALEPSVRGPPAVTLSF